MAGKKTSSRAEKKVSQTKKNTPPQTASKAQKAKKPASPPKKAPKVTTEYDNPIPSGTIIAALCLLLFVLFVAICINSDGALLRAVKSVVLGLIGRAGFYFSIPALAYLFWIFAFRRKNKAQMRGTCLVICILMCGAIYHLIMQKADPYWDMSLIPLLYVGGGKGSTGGVLCGLIAMAINWACGKTLSYLILALTAFFTLLGSMQITIPSIFRAIANRPRDDWEDDDDDYIEPAAIVVNKIANKQIEQKRKRREQTQKPSAAAALPPQKEEKPVRKAAPAPRQPVKEEPGVAVPGEQPVVDHVKQMPGKGAAFMDRIDGEISSPLAGTAAYIHEDIPSVFDEPIDVDVMSHPSDTPSRMPEMKADVPAKPAPAPAPKPAPAKATEEKPKSAVSAKEAAQSAIEVAAEIAQGEQVPKAAYCYPPVERLKRPAKTSADGTDEMRENSRRLNETLASFRIDAHIINVTRGPSVTRYEVELDKGVRLNKLTGCADDIALSLGASGVRIAAVPGKISVVGIEVPNRVVTTVSLREVIDSTEFAKAPSRWARISAAAASSAISRRCPTC